MDVRLIPIIGIASTLCLAGAEVVLQAEVECRARSLGSSGEGESAGVPAERSGFNRVDEVRAREGDGAGGDRNQRVGGDMDAAMTFHAGEYATGDLAIAEALPHGYPAPTPPGAIELKPYPATRRAIFSGLRNADEGARAGFWPLFQHLKSHGLEMTAPVEMRYHVADADEISADTAWSMCFVYREPTLGSLGADGPVRVVDSQPRTVLAIGLRGDASLDHVARGLAELTEWLEAQDEWIAAGEPRSITYNGPYVPRDRRWMEAQIPVERAR